MNCALTNTLEASSQCSTACSRRREEADIPGHSHVSTSSRRWLPFLKPLFVLFLLLSLVESGGAAPRFEDCVGSESCARCHQEQFQKWNSSTHGKAGGVPGAVKVIARFDGVPLQFKDAVVIPTNSTAGVPTFRVRMDGAAAFDIAVDAVVGGGHLIGGGTQSFFNRHPDGTMRFLPFDFIRKESVWFVQLRSNLNWVPISRDISLKSDLANWPPHRVLGTVSDRSNCQNCHGSQIAAAWDDSAKRFNTRFHSLSINCESCHGPGRRHVELAGQPGFEQRADIGLASLATLSKEASVKLCLQCHATKEALREDPFLPGAKFEDYFSLLLPLLSQNPYQVDGRVRSFSYQGNHLFSDCYRNGSMTCVDCHDPHGNGYRDVSGRALNGRFDNGQCTSCHASKGLATERHSHHKAGSPGDSCVACHMPFLQHQGVGTKLQFARSDHSIPIPRPAFDHKLGVENACQKCHADRGLAWQEEHAQKWWGKLKPHPAAVTKLNAFTRSGQDAGSAAALLGTGTGHVIGETAALATWAQEFLRPGMSNDARVVKALMDYARSSDVDQRALGLMSLHAGFAQHPSVLEFLGAQEGAGFSDAVRLRWSSAADTLASRLAAAGDYAAAIHFLDRALEAHPNNYVSLSHLARLRLQSGDGEGAVAALSKAIETRPTQATLWFQMGQMLAQLGRKAEAKVALEGGLKLNPEDAAARRLLEEMR